MVILKKYPKNVKNIQKKVKNSKNKINGTCILKLPKDQICKNGPIVGDK